MKRATGILITLLLSLKTIFCIAQESTVEAVDIYDFVIVADPEDSFVNLRETSSIRGNVIKQLQNGKVMFAFEQEGNWLFVEDSLTSGYIHKSLSKPITSLKKIELSSLTEKNAVFENENITVRITTKKFIKSEHSYKLDNNGYIELIDNKTPWGIDGELPRIEYSDISLKINGKTISLPKESFKDLYEPNLTSNSVYYDAERNNLYIVAYNSDGAGFYSLAFIIENKKYKERILEIPF